MPAPDRAASDRGIDSDFPVFGLMIEPLFHNLYRWKLVHFSVSSVPDILLLLPELYQKIQAEKEKLIKEGKIKIKDFDALDELIALCQDVMEKKDKAQPNRKKSILIEE